MRGRAASPKRRRSLPACLEALRLPTVLRKYGTPVKLAAAEGLDHDQFLARLIKLKKPGGVRRQSSFAGAHPQSRPPAIARAA